MRSYPVSWCENVLATAIFRRRISIGAMFAFFSAFGLALMAPPSAMAQAFTNLYSFKGTGGYAPAGAVIKDAAGNFYGTTNQGGAYGFGTVFELVNTSGTYSEKVLYSFTNSPDGAYPYAGLIMDAAGDLFGTTPNGGSSGYGIVFELVNSSGTYTERVLYSSSGSPDGGTIDSGVIMDAAGNLYGTTFNGGAYASGNVFELVNSSGTYSEKVLYDFLPNSGVDGANPGAGVIMDASGDLFGTTYWGGPQNAGTVFELVNTSGTYSEKVLYSFTNSPDGANPYGGGLIMDAAGDLYGATSAGGLQSAGTVFELVNASGTYSEKVLYSFTNFPDGAYPYGGLIMDAAGDVYGTTSGGLQNAGTAFELLNSSGSYSEKILHSFMASCGGDGTGPYGSLFMDASGNLYGTTTGGGANSQGTLFEIIAFSGTALPTVTTLTSSINPATAGDPVQFMASLSSSSGLLPSGRVTFSDGATVLGTQVVACGGATLPVTDAEALGIGTYSITAQYTPDVPNFASSSASMSQTVNEAGVALTSGNNTLTGNQTVNGSVSATSFSGNGAGLTGVAASGLNCIGCIGNSQLGITYAGSTTQGGPATSAVTALTALTLAGISPGSFLLTSAVGQPNGVASLDATGKVPAAQLPAATSSGKPAVLSGWCSGVAASAKGSTFSFAGLGAGVGLAGTACSDGTGASTVVGIPITSPGTLTNLQVYPGRASNAGTSLTFTVYKAAAPGWTFTTGSNQTTISALSFARVGTRVTLTLATGASFASGDQISVSGISGTYSAGTNCTSLSGTLFDGTFTVSSSTATTVVYTDSGLPANCGSNINNASTSGTVADNTHPTTSNATKTTPTATALTCTIDAPSTSASLVCSDTSHTVSVNAGDVISVVGASGRASGTETIGDIRVSLEKQ